MNGVIHDAVRHDNIEFLSLIIGSYSEFMNCKAKGDTNTSGLIFSNAILKRQKDIFKLLNGIRLSFEKQILNYKDDEGNNILHLVGKLSPSEQLDAICGVALQLQQELMWFEEVSQIVDPKHAKTKNASGKTPRDRSYEKTTALKDLAEKVDEGHCNFMHGCSNAYFATLVFAAVFTMPGIKEETRTPNFIQNLSFRIFVISDAIWLVSSSCSILTFLSILTARYADKDFHYVSPRKLVVGFSKLFLPIAAMMCISRTSKLSLFDADDDDEEKPWNLKKWKATVQWTLN
ncbi:hypothetical protein Patl1_12354 [Pistacia atlantica]|uniref:Uncharacterized protein n=1 Tax=Pistacia atlantica TaxID=434234 RepID=A0ACC1A7W6_9ROSI|nr:hypothetical protein Patl1_12354 [Pistacia atlantica]